MMNPQVSVIIPCYNAEAFIGATLKSVFDQTWPEIEVIVVDDGSTDGSVASVETCNDKRVRLIQQSNSGASMARNRGLEASTGEFIQFLDADDIIDPDKIALQMSRLTEHPDYVASGEWGRFYNSPENTIFAPQANWEDLSPVEWLVRSRFEMLFPALWLIPRGVAAIAGPWNEALTLGDDGEYFTRVVLASRGVLHCAGARSHYRSGIAGSLSSSRNWGSGFAVIELCEAHLRAREDTERVRRIFALSWQHLAHACYPYEPAIAERAMARARALHSAVVWPDGGPAFKLISRLLGWRAARRLQVASGRR
jgi:glycosyltransferase involved in cell wall biosynthesis